jgi:mevalonate kinase
MRNVKSITARSKVILLGEHAVVYGAHALATGLPDGVTVSIEPSSEPLSINISRWNINTSIGKQDDLSRALGRIVSSLGLVSPECTIKIEPHIPYGAGLGSSASVAAGCALALNDFFNLNKDTNSIIAAVNRSEQIFHTNPSGVDINTILTDGLILFSQKEGIEIIKHNHPPLIIVYSGQRGSTQKSVKHFAHMMSAHKGEAQKRVKAIDGLVLEAKSAIENSDYAELGSLMNKNQAHLEWFGLSTDSLNEICTIALQNGALGAKLTGGGNGGCAVIVCHRENLKKIASAIAMAGYNTIMTYE